MTGWCCRRGDFQSGARFAGGDWTHGSPREPTNEYVFPEDIYNQRKMDALFGRIQKYCFQGHTHLPGIFTPDYRFITPEDCSYQFKLNEQKVMINVGSVGQPRDENPETAYALFDVEEKRASILRIPYDIETEIARIVAAGLPEVLGERLRLGI